MRSSTSARTRSRRRHTPCPPPSPSGFRNEDLSADDVVEFRELTALADELRELTGGAGTIVMRPARLSAYLHALAMFVESRDEAEWIRDEDRESLAVTRGLLWPLEDLSADALQAALTGHAPKHA